VFEEQTGNTLALSHQATSKHLEQEYRERVREVYTTIHQSILESFTASLLDSLWNDLHAIIYELECLPEAIFKELIEVIVNLREAHNELRMAHFLFELEEVDPIRRFVMRHKAILRGKIIINKVLLVWPLYNRPLA
jgi:hypothetical protein